MPLRYSADPSYGPGATDEPIDPIAPIPEVYEGDVMPGGRGLEKHGVEPTAKYEPIPGYGGHTGDKAIVIEPEEDEPDPTPVRIVTTSRHTRRYFRAFTYTLTLSNAGTWKQILGRQDNRSSLTIGLKSLDGVNGPGRVWVGSGDGGAVPMDSGDAFSYNGSEEVQMRLDPAASYGAMLCIYFEYEVPE